MMPEKKSRFQKRRRIYHYQSYDIQTYILNNSAASQSKGSICGSNTRFWQTATTMVKEERRKDTVISKKVLSVPSYKKGRFQKKRKNCFSRKLKDCKLLCLHPFSKSWLLGLYDFRTMKFEEKIFFACMRFVNLFL
jgi:hypothetical protein